MHEEVCLQMKVAKHFIQVPMTNKTNDVHVDESTEGGHGTTSMETAGRHMMGIDTVCEVESGGTKVKNGSNMGGSNKSKVAGREKIKIERGSWGSQVLLY
jgi:hypothetical protein